MTSEASAVDWEDILDKFSSHKGSIKAFCEEHNISIHQLYYRRKRLKSNNNTVFHGVSLKKDADKAIGEQTNPSRSPLTSNIKIEIGKAKIYIPSDDKASLSNILKVIMGSC